MESLTLEQSYYIGELVAAIAVVISLIYVGLQVKQNTEATRVAASQIFPQLFSTLTEGISASNESSDLWLRGLEDFENLNRTEKVRFSSLLNQAVRVYESAYYQLKCGVLDKDIFDGFNRGFLDVMNEKGARSWWSYRKRVYGNEFQSWLDNQVDSGVAKPMYEFN